MWEEAEEAGRNARQLGALQASGPANPLSVLGPAKERCAGVSATPNSATEPRASLLSFPRSIERQALAIPRHAIPESQAHSRWSINA